MVSITNVLTSPEMGSSMKHMMGWLTPAAAYAALAFIGFRTIWDYLAKKGWLSKKNGGMTESASESAGGEVNMRIIEGLKADIQRIFDKIDELQKTVLENYCTKEEAEMLRADLRDTRDRVIRLEAERDAMKAQIAALPKRAEDK